MEQTSKKISTEEIGNRQNEPIEAGLKTAAAIRDVKNETQLREKDRLARKKAVPFQTGKEKKFNIKIKRK